MAHKQNRFATQLTLYAFAACLGMKGSLADDIHSFDIPAQDATAGIAQLALQAGRQIFAPSEYLVGVKTKPLKGVFSTERAISLLLKDTPLTVTSDDGHMIIVASAKANDFAAKDAPSLSGVLKEQIADEQIIVTGYRASLISSVEAKHNAVGFTDAVFAEDIGKFSDMNIAEALNRVSGITINREVNGEGVQAQIRGLGANFTKILINENPIAVASMGTIDASNLNREVDLNMFPTELFTQLVVSKSPQADQIEGGAAGSVSMRPLRPFDRPGFHIFYNIQVTDQPAANSSVGKRGSLIASNTIGSVGVLIGLAGVQSNTYTTGWEDGNASWYGPNLPGVGINPGGGVGGGTCTAPGTVNVCSQFNSRTWTIPKTILTGVFVPIPSGYKLDTGYTPTVADGISYFPVGYPVSQRMLYALNPQLSDPSCSALNPSATCLNQMSTRLSNALLPRLGRSMFEKGSRNRYNATLAFEYRPDEHVYAYFDLIFAKIENHYDRSDADWGVRAGTGSSEMIPANLRLSKAWLGASALTKGLGGAVQSGTFYNATYSIEGRDYREAGDFLHLNPGFFWKPSDLLKIEFQANYSSSHFLRRDPTILVSTCTGGPLPESGTPNCPNGFPVRGTILQFNNEGSHPQQTINIDLNNPKNFEWYLGRVNLAGENRWTTTHGVHLSTSYGSKKTVLKIGAAYDVASRLGRSYRDDIRWQSAVCGGSPSAIITGPNTALPACTGQTAAGETNWTPTNFANVYAGWGTGYTTGAAPLTFSGSLIPTSELSKYLKPSRAGFVAIDYNKLFAASNYYSLQQLAYSDMQCVPRCAWIGKPTTNIADYHPANFDNQIDERTVGMFGRLSGELNAGNQRLRYDIGLRWIETRQFIATPGHSIVDERNFGPDQLPNTADDLRDGGLYPNYTPISSDTSKYHAYFPSASFVFDVSDSFLIRLSTSRTMTRANPGDMGASMSFYDSAVQTAVLGNPKLKPFFSTNYDIGTEYYTDDSGYVGLTAFRKAITGFTAQTRTLHNFAYLAAYGITYGMLNDTMKNAYAQGGQTGVPCNSDATCASQPIYVNQQVNLSGLKIINGLELTAVTPLDFITKPYLGIEGFGFNGDLSIIDQKSTGEIPLYALDVAPVAYNVTGYYENNGVMLRLSYNWTGTAFTSIVLSTASCLPASTNGTLANGCPGGAYIFTKSHGQTDFSSSLNLSNIFGRLPTNLKVTFDVKNVFRAKQMSFVQFPDTVHRYYDPGQVFFLGFRGAY